MTGPRIGWIGVGRMGRALAARLLADGYDLAVYNRSRGKAEELAAHGATVVESPAELADRDVVFTIVADGPALTAVTTGPGGVLAGDKGPGVLVDCSTVSMAESAGLRAAGDRIGTAVLAAPVSGNPRVVATGRATLAVSGPRPAFDRVEPALRALGRGVTYVGDGEVARLVKICHNVLLGVVAQSLAEITVLAEKGGTSRTAFLSFLNDSVLGSAFSRYKSPALVELDFRPTFTMTLLGKDLGLGLDAAAELGAALPLAERTLALVTAAAAAGHAGEDFAALIVEQARAAGLDLVPEPGPIDDGLDGGTGRAPAAGMGD